MFRRADSPRPSRWLRRLLGKPARPARSNLGVATLDRRDVPATYNVTSLGDNGLNTLRAALISSGITSGPDTININVTGSILLSTGELTVPGDVTINGPTSGSIIISGQQAQRVFNTSGAPANSVITMSNLTVMNGKVAGSGAGLLIGDESVTLTDCSISGNTSTGDGGGIHVAAAAGSLTLNHCFISQNYALGAGNDGGGVSLFAASTLVMDRSAVLANSAADCGGGIYLRQGGQFTITNSSIYNNAGGSASTSIGGGVYFFGTASGPLVMQDCTISGNFTGGPGGGMVLGNFTGSLQLESCTITKNSSNAAGVTGGGIARTGGSGTLSLNNTIVAGNKSATGDLPDVSFNTFSVVTGNYNLVGVVDGSNGLFSVVNNQLGTKASPLDAKLGVLAYNGGPTVTHRPLSGSPAVDKGSSSIAFDQRGVTRTVGASADIGSVEAPDSFLVTNANDSGAGSLRRAISDSNLDMGIFNGIYFDTAYFATPRTIHLSSGELTMTDGGGVFGPGNLTIDADSTSRHFNIDGPGNIFVGLIGMTLTNGNGSGAGGGSIRIANEIVTLSQVNLIDNQAVNGDGGAILVESLGAELTVDQCHIVDNFAMGSFVTGGGIAVLASSKLTVQSSRISGNTTQEDGGGIMMDGGTLAVIDSTIDNNVANFTNLGNGGGGVYFFSGGTGVLTILNSTISANQAQNFSKGGGVTLVGTVDNVAIRNSTITGNSAASKGGGVFLYNGFGTLNIESSIVAGNKSDQSAPDVHVPTTVNAVRCAIGNTAGINILIADGVTNSLTGANLKLGALADNGGPVPTHLPAIDSPLVNQGSNPAAKQYDQRGIGYLRSRSGQADIGAVEASTQLVVTNDNNSGPGSLRQAALDANALVGPDTIVFDTTFFSTPRTIKLTTSDIGISEAVTIVGPGAKLVTVSGNNTYRIFDTVDAPTGTPINISGLTITAGKAVQGGAIRVSNEQLNLTDCVLTGNVSTDNGGAVAAIFGGGLSLINCTFTGNFATMNGGAIFASGSTTLLSIQGCTVSGNQASSGGGIYSNAKLALENSTVSGNQASGVTGGGIGGGVQISPYDSGTAVVRNSTISGNKAQADGGGIGVRGLTNVVLLIQNSTITANTAVTGKGGGLSRAAAYAINLDSSIVSGNSNGAAADIASPGPVNVNFSAVGDPQGFTLSGANNVPFGSDLKLGPLANNGGPTLTHALLAGSPAINKGANSASLSFDQRGQARVMGGTADIGAFESTTAAPVAKVLGVTVNGGAAQRSMVTQIDVQFDGPVSFVGEPTAAFTLTRQFDNAAVNLAATLNGAGDKVTLTFTGGAVNGLSLADGRYTLTALALQFSGSGLDGNNDGVAGDNYVLTGHPGSTPKLFRLFGDVDADNDVDATDFGAFRAAFGGGASAAFDFDSDGDVDTSDFGAFRSRFGASI